MTGSARRWRGGSQVWTLRAVVVLAPLLACLLTGVVGPAPAVWFVLLLLVLSVGWAVFSESAVGVAVLTLALTWWAVGPEGDEALHPVVVAAAACLVAAHLAALLLSYAPAEAVLSRALLVLWVRRGLIVLLSVPVLLGAALLLRGDVDVAGAWTAGLVGVTAATVLCLVAVRTPAGEAR